MILGEVEETITTIEIDEETFEQNYRVNRKLLYIHSYIDLSVLFFSQRKDKYRCYLYVVMV
jgi:hypothetical protein